MSAPGRRMDSPKWGGMDACTALCFPLRLVGPWFLCNAHMVDTHSCRSGSRPSHIVRFTDRRVPVLAGRRLRPCATAPQEQCRAGHDVRK